MSAKNPFDFSDLFSQVDSTGMVKQFQEMFSNSSFAPFDSAAMAELQRKNIQAMVEVSQAAISGSQALLQKQTEMMQTAIKEAADAIQASAALKSNDQQSAVFDPDEVVVNGTEAIEKALQSSMENFSEISAMIEQIYAEVSGKVDQRMKENLEELQQALSKIR